MQRNLFSQITDEAIYNIETLKEGQTIAYLGNLKTSVIQDEDLIERSVVSLYMVEPNGNWFHTYLKYEPYFYILCRDEIIKDMTVYLERKFEKKLASIEVVDKVDLELINHLSGKLNKYIRLNFRTTLDLVQVRNVIRSKVEQNKAKSSEEFSLEEIIQGPKKKYNDLLDSILDIREYDISYHSRTCIDKNIRISYWYDVVIKNNFIQSITPIKEKTTKPDLHILAFDIETTKLPMKFPDARFDQIMMISYVIDGDAFLITNREIVSQDIEDFEYTPKPEYEGKIKVMNEVNEAAVLERFFAHIKQVKPMIIVTYNGDFFDWPFVEARAAARNMNMQQLIGISSHDGEYYGRYVTHMDCMYWVNRDAYLPQGSRGLKAVTKAKLGYDPTELHPELMLPMAKENPQMLSEYSVSDAIATYYLYKKHIHGFIYALCSIIPMFPDEVLRSGSGTLCENLLMAEAFQRNMIFPNKKKENFEKFYNGHLLDSETYIGGKVECINSGVYRADLPTKFKLDPKGYQGLIDNIDKTFEFIAEKEAGFDIKQVTNYDQVKEAIIEKLAILKTSAEAGPYDGLPLIYHLDVSAMYPNIILTNRLQPVAIVDDKICSGCLFNRVENNCKRNLNWVWKGDYFPLTRREYETAKIQIEYEYMKESDGAQGNGFFDLPLEEQHTRIKKRVKTLSQKIYKQMHISKNELKENTVCMRENSFYVDTVRAFRDRRYEFKHLVKVWKTKLEEYEAQGNLSKAQECIDNMILYESLQLAHKIILNSFYGYVMRRGARWYSMEMAAMVTHIGSSVISDARVLVDQIGKPLELDTDGIWCLLPEGFPENFSFQLKNGKSVKFSYPCSILNILVHDKYSNPQYQTLVDEKTLQYKTNTEMSIFFEVDGPYKAMIIPAAREEGKVLKKRYAVYNFNGTIAEIKGFELKRRGELKIIKIFQQDIFNHYLDGKSIAECYGSCGAVAEKWLDILYRKGEGVDDEELLDYIAESKTLSKEIGEYEDRKGVALTAAKRMSDFLGSEIIQGKGLNTYFIIAQKPIGEPVSSRAIPISIFNAEEAIKRKYLKKWLKESEIKDSDMRKIIDWDYYIGRLENTIQKMLVIPAALQKVPNPVPRVNYPDWLNRIVRDTYDQKKVDHFFEIIQKKKPQTQVMDIEDMGADPTQRQEARTKTKSSQALLKNYINLSKNPFSSGKNSKEKNSLSLSQPNDLAFMNSQTKNELLKENHNMDTDFKGWLKWQKEIWRTKRKKGGANFGTFDSSNKITSMYRSVETNVAGSVWHVLQIHESETPGIFKMWVYLENANIISLRVKIKRTFYINSLTQAGSEDFKLVKKKLPRDKRSAFLYERTIDEEEFRNRFHSFDQFLTNPEIEGVYETKVPLEFKFISEAGSIVRFYRNKDKPYTSYASYLFDIDELRPLFNYEKPYLTEFEIPFIVISQISIKGKNVWGLFNSENSEYHLCVIEKSLTTNIYKKVVKEIFKANTPDAEDLDFKISVTTYEKNELAIQHLEELLKKIRNRPRANNYIIIVQSQFKLQRLMQLGLKSLVNEFPTLHLPIVDSSEIVFSSLDWQVKCIRQLCLNYLSLNEVLDELVNVSRYSHIPLCNLKHDRLNHITDVLYARILKQAGCVSWYSESGNPEIGGGKLDDARESIPTDFISSEVIHSNLYTDYCAEIDLGLLALNTICASDELKNVDKETSKLIDNNKNLDDKFESDESGLSKTAFKFVKVMADHWFLDVINHSSRVADKLLENLHRWVADEESRFYDTMLYKMVTVLMKKFFGFLLAKLKSLGAKIIYANLSKIIISTGKYNYSEAENYSLFILKTVISYPLFAYLNLAPKTYWKILLFKDNFNFGGVTENDENRITSSWNISEYLPPKLEEQFLIVVAEYLSKINKFMTKLWQEEDPGLSAKTEELQSKINTFCKKYISEILSAKFFNAIPQLNELYREYLVNVAERENNILRDEDGRVYEEEYSDEDDNYSEKEIDYRKETNKNDLTEWDFPKLIGRIPDYDNGVLEFIKFVIHVLNLDESVMEDVLLLNRTCLKLLGISDFAEKSKYHEPCKKIVLNDIVCSFCSNVVDVDVFRDRVFKERNYECQMCQNKFDEKRLEVKIIKLIKQMLIFYQIQDLYCHKCKMAKSDYLKKICSCAGSFTIKDDTPAYVFKRDLKQMIKNFEELAIHCDFELLQVIF